MTHKTPAKSNLPVRPRMLQFTALLLPLTIAFMAVSCDNTTEAPFDRGAMLESIASNVIVPTYEELAASADTLADAAEVYCAAPTGTGAAANLEAVRTAHRDTLIALRHADAFAFGPHTDQPLRLGPLIDSWPVDPDRVQARLADGTTTAEELEIEGVRIKGLPVVGYLLHGPEEELGAWEADGLRCQYLVGATARVAAVSAQFPQAWAPSGGDHSGVFATGQEPYGSVFSAASLLTEQLVFLTENARELRVGKPFGKRSAGALRLEEFEAAYGELSLAAVRGTIESLLHVYDGELSDASSGTSPSANGMGFGEWVVDRAPEADAQFRSDLAAVFAAIDAVDSEGSLEALVAESEASEASYQVVEDLYQALKTLQTTLAVEVAGALGVTVTFNPTDGD